MVKNRFNRIMAMVLALLMVAGLTAGTVYGDVREGLATVVQDLEGIVPENEEEENASSEAAFAQLDPVTDKNLEEAADYVRSEMVKRTPTIKVDVVINNVNLSDVYNLLMEKVFKYTSKGDEGDYLDKARDYMSGLYSMSTKNGENHWEAVLSPTYKTTAAQEQEVTKKIDSIMAQLSMSGDSEYQKVKKIYDYIVSNVKYDYDHLNDPSYLPQYTAYAALFHGKAVCQGYSMLFYRLAHEAGLSARIITGTANGGGHAWNIVKIGGIYYNVDTTFATTSYTSEKYFLKGTSNFQSHVSNSEYQTQEFKSAFPVSANDYVLQSVDPRRESVEAFVSRLYQNFFGRAADRTGLAAWTDALLKGTTTGSKVVYKFIYSDEFQNKPLADEAFVEAMYRTIFGREADKNGRAAWAAVLENGCTRKKVLAGFLNSDEMERLCSSMGITAGEYYSDEVVDQNSKVTYFVSRMYRYCLGRKADKSGLAAWVTALLNGKATGTKIATGFFFSDELERKNLDNRAYVRNAYLALLGREPDVNGWNGWTDALAKGGDRSKIVYGFINSDEFANLCAEYGISR